MTLPEIQNAKLADPTLQKLAELIHSQQWHSVLNNDLTHSNDAESIDLQDLKAFYKVRHELTVQQAETMVKHCLPCQAANLENKLEPLKISCLPTAAAVIPKLDKIFATHDTPELLKTDKGPPFTSYSFKAFARELGFQHRKITPL